MDENNPINLSTEELRELKTQYNRAKEVLEKINSLTVRYDAAFRALDTRKIDVEKFSDDILEKAKLVETSKDESLKLVTEVKSNLEKIQSGILQIEEATIKFEGIKGRIQGKEGEMDALLSAAKGLRDDVEKTKTTAQQRLAEIESQFVQVKDRIVQMQNAHDSFIAVHARITDPNTGLQAILDKSVDLRKQSSETFTEIKTYQEQSKKYVEQIKSIKTETDKIRIEVQQNLKEINFSKTEVEKITALITDTGFANSFQKREKMLRWSAGVWLAILIASVAWLSWILHASFLNIQGVPELSVILYRLTLTSPLLFLIGIAVNNYSNERSLNEKYAFKATIAAVMRSHSDFLIQVGSRGGPDNTLFIRTALEGVYVEPYEKNPNLKDVRKELKEILDSGEEKKKSKLFSVFSTAKELKELVPDEGTLKEVIELLSKFK